MAQNKAEGGWGTSEGVPRHVRFTARAVSSTLSRSSLTTPFIRAVITHKTMADVDFERGWWLESVRYQVWSRTGRREFRHGRGARCAVRADTASWTA